MATFIIPILGVNTLPDTSGNVYPEVYSNQATNDRWPFLTYTFEDTATRIGLAGMFRVPKNFASAAKIRIEWTAAATSGDVVWDFDYRAVGGDNAESMDQTGQQQQVTAPDTAPSAVHNRLSFTMDLTDANLAIDDLVEFVFYRDGAHASDTMTAAAILFGLYFQYSD
jgi:hypothetical protein